MTYNPLTSHANITYQYEFTDKVEDFDLDNVKEFYAEFESGYRINMFVPGEN